MQPTINEQIKLLKKELNITDVELCAKTGISTSTLHKIKKGGLISPRKLNAIAHAFRINKEWLIKGEGPMFTASNTLGRDLYDENSSYNGGKKAAEETLWQDATYKSLQEQITILKTMLKHLSKGELNFLKPLKKTDSAKILKMLTESLKAA